MKCPYIFDVVGQVCTYGHDVNGVMKMMAMQETRRPMDCLQEECGAWRKDHCNYNQGQNYDP